SVRGQGKHVPKRVCATKPLYAEKITSVKDYKLYSDKLKPVVSDTVQQILKRGVTVVLDFPANTERQRLWLRNISDEVHSEHTCYFVDRSDEVCIKQLLKRGNPKTDTVEMFHAVTRYFTEPSNSENINTVRV
ncbi:AAA family ATPase, partial [Thalassobacter stenotrophicus]|uniref:AAA family ATPase n=1 Tax=Thalassobacter stenotrophicus TaxID=266809 RepID=UPI0009EC516D